MVAIADIRQVVAHAGQLAVGYYGKVTGSVKADQTVVSEADGAVDLASLVGRDKVHDALYAGGPAIVELLRQRITPRIG